MILFHFQRKSISSCLIDTLSGTCFLTFVKNSGSHSLLHLHCFAPTEKCQPELDMCSCMPYHDVFGMQNVTQNELVYQEACKNNQITKDLLMDHLVIIRMKVIKMRRMNSFIAIIIQKSQ